MEAVELLRKLVSINSVYPNERELGEFLESYLKEIGFSVQRQKISDGRFNVLAEKGTQGKSILFYGHMDTVPASKDWARNPFILTEEEDNLRGLGVWDMKAGLAIILKAVEDSKRNIKIAFCVDEENISEGVHKLAEGNFLNNVEYALCSESGDTNRDHLGVRMMTLGRRGRAVYLIEVHGIAAHGGLKIGKSALLAASRIVQFLENMELRTHEMLPQATQFVRRINSEAEGLTTPERAVIELDRHLVPPETFESVLEELREQLKEFEKDGIRINVSIKERKTPYINSYVTPRDNEHVRRIEKIIRERFGEVKYEYGSSVADEGVIAGKGIPVITIGPKGGDDHSPNEWLSKKSFLETIELYKEIIK